MDDLAEQYGLDAVVDRSELPPEIALLDKPPVVIVADCGTGETKLLLYSVEAGSVCFRQLAQLGPASSYVDAPEEFIDCIRGHFASHKADMVLVAASAWMRNANDDLVQRGNDLLQRLADAVVIWKTLAPREEAWLELVAAEHACERLGLDIDASWAAGGGSTQMTRGFTEIHPLDIGNRKGLELLKAHGARSGIAQWRAEVRHFYKDAAVRLTGQVLAISAVSHAAKASGLNLQQFYPRTEVLRSFDAYIERQSAAKALSDEDLLNLANVVQQRETLDLVVAQDASLYFVRDIGDGETRLRITWSLGWYLELLAIIHQGPAFGGALQRLWADRRELTKIGADITGGKGGSDAATGQVVRDLERGANALRERARAIEGEVTEKLRSVAQQFGARLEGENHRLKTEESLERKLKQRLTRLLEKHRSHRFYYPRLADVFHEVDDALRYTMVVPDAVYAQTARGVLEALKVQLPSSEEHFNYWTEGSTYRGVNAFVTCEDFTFELQFHTETSWRVKQQASHEIYESFRLLPAGRAKHVLYDHMKRMWDAVPIPPGIEQLNRPVPMRDPLLEQLGQLMVLKQRCAGSALALLNGSAFAHAEERRALMAGLGCRLIRGTDSSHFERLAYSQEGKRLAWISDLSELPPVLDRREAIIRLMGKPAEWVDKKLSGNDAWKLLLMPAQFGQPATWDGVLRSVQDAYPEVAHKVLKFGAALKSTPFETIQAEAECGCTFRELKDAGPGHPQSVTLEQLITIADPALWQVRAFLYIVVGLNEQFAGDGYTYDDRGVRQGKEFLLQNLELAKIPGCELFDL